MYYIKLNNDGNLFVYFGNIQQKYIAKKVIVQS